LAAGDDTWTNNIQRRSKKKLKIYRRKKKNFFEDFLISSVDGWIQHPANGRKRVSFSHTRKKKKIMFRSGCIKIKTQNANRFLLKKLCCFVVVGGWVCFEKETHNESKKMVCHGKKKKMWKTRQSKCMDRYAR
jgi:hypothetical protein